MGLSLERSEFRPFGAVCSIRVVVKILVPFGVPARFRVEGLGFRGLGFWGLGFRVLGLGFKVFGV